MGDGGIVAVYLCRTVPYRQAVAEIPKAKVVFRFFFGAFSRDLLVVLGVFLPVAVNFAS